MESIISDELLDEGFGDETTSEEQDNNFIEDDGIEYSYIDMEEVPDEAWGICDDFTNIDIGELMDSLLELLNTLNKYKLAPTDIIKSLRNQFTELCSKKESLIESNTVLQTMFKNITQEIDDCELLYEDMIFAQLCDQEEKASHKGPLPDNNHRVPYNYLDKQIMKAKNKMGLNMKKYETNETFKNDNHDMKKHEIVKDAAYYEALKKYDPNMFKPNYSGINYNPNVSNGIINYSGINYDSNVSNVSKIDKDLPITDAEQQLMDEQINEYETWLATQTFPSSPKESRFSRKNLQSEQEVTIRKHQYDKWADEESQRHQQVMEREQRLMERQTRNYKNLLEKQSYVKNEPDIEADNIRFNQMMSNNNNFFDTDRANGHVFGKK